MKSIYCLSKKETFFQILFVLLFLLCSNLNAANDSTGIPMFYFGGYVDYNLNIHTAEFVQLTPLAPTCCPMYESATGSGFSIGLLFEKPIPSVSKTFALGARLGYASLNAAFAEEEIGGNVEVRETTPPYATITTTDGVMIHHLESQLGLINFNIYVSNNIFDKLVGSIGLNFGFLSGGTFDQWEDLSSPDNVVYVENNQRTRNKTIGTEIPNFNNLHIGASIGLGYELPISKNSYLIPEVRYNFAFVNITDAIWKTHYLQLGAAVKFPIYGGSEEPKAVPEKQIYERDTIIKKRFDIAKAYVELTETSQEGNIIYESYTAYQPEQAELSVNMNIYGIDKDGKRQANPLVVIEEFATTESFPMLPNIYFPDGSSDLAASRLNLLTAKDIEKFNQQELKADALSIYYNSLNVFAKRMLENPRIRITISGYSSGEGRDKTAPGVALSRANAVKNYLVNVWKISELRLTATEKPLPVRSVSPESKADADNENRKVELSPTTGDYIAAVPLFQPIQLTHIERVANPPQVEFETDVISEAGIDVYDLSISQDNNELRKFSGRATKTSVFWDIVEVPLPLQETAVVATLQAKDLIGQVKEISKEVEIDQITLQEKREQIEDNWKIERYSLILFEYDKSDISQVDRQLLSEIKKSSIKPNSVLTISGFADRTGNKQYNKNLAQRRCEEVAKILEKNNAIINAVGSDRLLFDNNLPEGRALSRTVQIEIKTPIE